MDLLGRYRIDVDGMSSVIPSGPDLMSERRPVCSEPFEERLWNVGLFRGNDSFYRIKNSFYTPIFQILSGQELSPMSISQRECLGHRGRDFQPLRQPLQP